MCLVNTIETIFKNKTKNNLYKNYKMRIKFSSSIWVDTLRKHFSGDSHSGMIKSEK